MTEAPTIATEMPAPRFAAVPRRRRLGVNGTIIAGAVLLACIVLIAAVGPFLMPYAPDAFGPPLQPPSLEYLRRASVGRTRDDAPWRRLDQPRVVKKKGPARPPAPSKCPRWCPLLEVERRDDECRPSDRRLHDIASGAAK